MTGPYGEGSSSDEEEGNSWIQWFCGLKGNEYYSEVDSDFILDRFNLTGLGHDVPHAQKAYDLIADEYRTIMLVHYYTNLIVESDDEEDVSPEVEASARLLYGLIHARFIICPNGLHKMKRKYMSGEFGTCPRVLCNGQLLIPVGLSDVPRTGTVKLFCCHCQDVYNPKSSAHNAVDGAYFGTTFAHLFFQTYPHLRPSTSTQVYTPKIFGFRIAGERTLASLSKGDDDMEEEEEEEEEVQ